MGAEKIIKKAFGAFAHSWPWSTNNFCKFINFAVLPAFDHLIELVMTLLLSFFSRTQRAAFYVTLLQPQVDQNRYLYDIAVKWSTKRLCSTYPVQFRTVICHHYHVSSFEHACSGCTAYISISKGGELKKQTHKLKLVEQSERRVLRRLRNLWGM